tara:strand:+ start:517 stop:1722 length:1206 start_codon:yes stop_codon:yes gene_type:complete
MIKPELLAPAGNMEKLQIAYRFGADAAYIGGKVFGLRKYSDNFSLYEIEQAVRLANQLNKQLYVVLNGFAHDEDCPDLITHLKALEDIQPHAFIVSDLGVAQLVNRYTSIPLHVSTQASITNHYGCQFWKDHGAKRIILAREVSILDCIDIQKKCPIELEIFVHGAMCASYSGKCTISNISAGRDSNRGGCVQSCRHKYDLIDPNNNEQLDSKHIMNAKDLMGLYQIPACIKASIASLKIEGRMKSNLYVANAVRSYRSAIDYCYEHIRHNQTIEYSFLNRLETQLRQVSNRDFSSGGLEHIPAGDSIHYNFGGYQKQLDYIGIVRDVIDEERVVIDVKNTFKQGDQLTVLKSESDIEQLLPINNFWSLTGENLVIGKQNSLISLPYFKNAKPFDVITRQL